jgi:hypothetical protein
MQCEGTRKVGCLRARSAAKWRIKGSNRLVERHRRRGKNGIGRCTSSRRRLADHGIRALNIEVQGKKGEHVDVFACLVFQQRPTRTDDDPVTNSNAN